MVKKLFPYLLKVVAFFHLYLVSFSSGVAAARFGWMDEAKLHIFEQAGLNGRMLDLMVLFSIALYIWADYLLDHRSNNQQLQKSRNNT